MDVVQNGIKQPNLRLTFPLTLYIARTANQMLRPGIMNPTLPFFHVATVSLPLNFLADILPIL